MSHFTVLVVGEDIEEQLAPFNEQLEENSPYIEFNDLTEKYQYEYENKKIEVVRLADGSVSLKWNKEYEVRLEEEIFSHIEYRYPKESKLEEISLKEFYSTFEEFVEDWHGSKEVNGRYGYYHNPNAKWDWYSVGGRWNGFFELKPNPLIESMKEIVKESGLTEEEVFNLIETKKNYPDDFESILEKVGEERGIEVSAKLHKMIDNAFPDHEVGTPGVFGNRLGDYTGLADVVLKKDIDIEGMRDKAEGDARRNYDLIKYFYGGNIPFFNHWSYYLKMVKDEEIKMEEAQNQYWAQDALTRKGNAFRINKDEELGLKQDFLDNIFFSNLEDFDCTEDEYAQIARNNAITTFAILKDGEWSEVISNEMKEDDWSETFTRIFNSIPDDTLLTIVDCHI